MRRGDSTSDDSNTDDDGFDNESRETTMTGYIVTISEAIMIGVYLCYVKHAWCICNFPSDVFLDPSFQRENTLRFGALCVCGLSASYRIP